MFTPYAVGVGQKGGIRAFFTTAALVFSVLFPRGAFADSGAAAFLKLHVDPREMAVGSGMAAIGGDVGSISYNPAGLGQLRDKELNVLYAPHLQGTNLGSFAYALPTEHGTFGISYLTLRSNALEGRDDAGNKTADFNAEDNAVALSFGRVFFSDKNHPAGLCRLGTNLKYVSSRIGGYGASTYAMDLGAQFPLKLGSVPLSVGTTVRNLGAPIKFLDEASPLPLSAALGAAVQPVASVVVSGGITRFVHERRTEFSTGAEYMPMSKVALRGGCAMSRAAGGLGATQFALAGGVGLKWKNLAMDYAFSPMGDLGSTQRISLTFHFESSSVGVLTGRMKDYFETTSRDGEKESRSRARALESTWVN